jgi:hypothetical protein
VDLWERGIATRLLQPVMDLFDEWRVRQAGLFTFAHSPKHVHLYQKFGFWPQHLTAVMERHERLARAQGLERLVLGVNVARHDAYRRLLARGYRTAFQGVVMQRRIEPGYCRPDVHAIDDLR